MMFMGRILLLTTGIFYINLYAGDLPSVQNNTIPEYTYLIVKRIPHDYQAYTQGLVFDHNYLYESTGRHGQSSLRKVDPDNGAILAIHKLPQEFFGEGITIYKDKIYQLTWQEFTGFVYDRETFLVMEEFFYTTEGWGITHDDTHLIISDGTALLYFLDPQNYEVLKTVEVKDNTGPVKNLNELEYINGEIFANILYIPNMFYICFDFLFTDDCHKFHLELIALRASWAEDPDIYAFRVCILIAWFSNMPVKFF